MDKYKNDFIRLNKWLDVRLVIVLLIALITTLAFACGGDEVAEQPQKPDPAAPVPRH